MRFEIRHNQVSRMCACCSVLTTVIPQHYFLSKAARTFILQERKVKLQLLVLEVRTLLQELQLHTACTRLIHSVFIHCALLAYNNSVLNILRQTASPGTVKPWYNEIHDTTHLFQIPGATSTSFNVTRDNTIPDTTNLSRTLDDFRYIEVLLQLVT